MRKGKGTFFGIFGDLEEVIVYFRGWFSKLRKFWLFFSVVYDIPDIPSSHTGS